MDLVKTTADGAAALGAQRLIVSGAGLEKGGTVSEQDLAAKVAGLNTAARYCRDKGLKLAYHNHGPEFAAGGAEMTGLIKGTDPALVEFVVDCGWASRAKVDLAAFFTASRARMVGMHLRDFKGDASGPARTGRDELEAARRRRARHRLEWLGDCGGRTGRRIEAGRERRGPGSRHASHALREVACNDGSSSQPPGGLRSPRSRTAGSSAPTTGSASRSSAAAAAAAR